MLFATPLVPMAHMGLLWKSAGQERGCHLRLQSDTSSRWDCSPAIGSPQQGTGKCPLEDVCVLPPPRASLDFIPCPPSLDLEIVGVRVEGRRSH